MITRQQTQAAADPIRGYAPVSTGELTDTFLLECHELRIAVSTVYARWRLPIVVAEDDEILRYCTAKLIRQHGYKVIEASDGIEALEIVERCEDAVHLLVTNYDMPRLNGVELARRLKAKHERLMVLVISGSDPQIDQADHIEVLPKPYNEAVSAAKVRDFSTWLSGVLEYNHATL